MRARTAGGSRRAGAVRRGLLLGALAAAALVALLLAQAPFGALRGALDAEPHGRPPLPSPRKQAWEREHGGPIEARVHLRRRLVGWPERRLVPPEALPADDRAFLERVAADTWRGIAALVDREHALPIDHIVLGPDDLDPRAADIGDYTSATNVGLYLVSVVAARELGLIDDAEAHARVAASLETLTRLETWRGFLFNYYDTTTLDRTSAFVSFVDSSWLVAGLLVARQALPALAARCDALLAERDFAVFYDPALGRMLHGFYVDPLRRSPFHYGALYTEARLGSLLAIGRGDVPVHHWHAMARTAPPWLPAAAGDEAELLESWRRVPPEQLPDGTFTWGGVRYVPSWGGSMFEALMPLLVLDEIGLAPESFGTNARAHVEVQRRYALEHLGYPVWGMSPSWRPDGLGYGEFGVRVLGTAGYPAGAVTPHASALALLVDPAAATANLRELVRRYPIYGPFGFYDAVDPESGRVVPAWLTLDQAMILIALANHLRDGAVQAHFAADPAAAALRPLLANERFFDVAPGRELGAGMAAAAR